MNIIKKMTTSVLSLSLLFASTLSISSSASAEMKWSDFSLSYLYSDQYEVGDKSRQFLSVEHASGHDWGDTFFFTDFSKSKDGTRESYMEFTPRVSLSYVSGNDLSFGIVNDVYIASQWEHGEFFDNYSIGLGVSLKVPGFSYFSANIFQVNNGAWENDKQLAVVFGYPFKLGGADFLYDGFLDWTTSSDTNKSEMNFTTQLKYDLGGTLGTKAPVYIGIEYAHWNNKFGIPDADERSTSLLLQWHF
jgi:nucleoside-specific outer membrane channel protein Tsx